MREAKRQDVNWLARTDPVGKTIEFSTHWDRLEPEAKRYIVLHERAHLETGPDHNERFYEALKKLIAKHGVSWKVAYEMESYNCLSGSTRFWADGELVTLREKVGQTVRVLAGDGRWRKARVRNFGEAKLFKFVLSPLHMSAFRLTYTATKDHRWITSNRGEVTDLRIGDRIMVRPRAPSMTKSFWLGRVHGLVFGDGAATTGQKDWYQIRLCGKKNIAHLRWLKRCAWYRTHSTPASYGGDVHVRFKTDISLKAVPSSETDLEYQSGFLQGWLDADATKISEDHSVLDSIDHEAVEWVIERAPLLGWCVSGRFVVSNVETNMGRRTRKLMRLSLRLTQREYVVRQVRAVRVAPVYCVTEPVTGAFTLDGGVVTGNCHKSH